MKKLKRTLLCFAVCAAAAATFAACGETEETECEHDWGDWAVTTPATCTQAGEKTRVCKKNASHKETDTVPALDHDWGDWEDTTPSTCNTAGEKARVCKHDASHKETAPLELVGHNWNPWTVEAANKPTETEGGKATRTCKYDGCTAGTELTEYALPALDSDDYTVGEDSAKPGVPGEVTYTYDKNSVTVEITVATPALPHEHVWGKWEATKIPTTGAKGKAVRTCTGAGDCDATAADTEYELPTLTNAGYTKGEDTATSCLPGTQKYTLAIGNDSVSFDVVTAAKADFKTVAMNSTSSSVVLPSGSSLALKNGVKPHYECNVCHKTFYNNSGHTDDYEVTLTDNIIISQKINGRTMSVPHYGVAKVGKNTMYGNRSYGILFKATESGIYKISSAEAQVLGVIGYYGSSETGTTSCTIYDGGWKKDAVQFARFTRSPETPETASGKYVYVQMDAGDVVSVSYGGANRVSVDVEKISEAAAPLCQMHVAGAYDLSAISANGGNLEKKCAVCHETIETITYKKGIELGQDAVAAVESGAAIVKSEQTTVSFSFTASKTGVYVISLSALSAHTLSIGSPVKFDGANVAMYLGGAWAYNPPFGTSGNASNGTLSVETNEIMIKIGAEQVNKALTFTVEVTGDTGAEKPVCILSEIETQQVITEGKNDVVITEANALGNGVYTFVPTATKAYSITVPAGLYVAAGTEDLGEGGRFNFDATKDEAIIFYFTGSEAKTYTVTIGDAVDNANTYTLNVDEDPLGVMMKGKTLMTVNVGNAVVGKTYTVTVGGAFFMGKQMGQGTAQFKFNGTDVDFDSMFDSDAGQLFYANPGSEVNVNGCTVSRSGDAITLTFTATGNDTLYFSVSNKNVSGDLGALTLVMTEVVAS